METLAVARDWAILILAVQGFVALAVVLGISYYLHKGMRRLMGWSRPSLRQARSAVVRTSRQVDRAILQGVDPLAGLVSLATGLRVGADAFLHRASRRRQTSDGGEL
jgi:hypothetical protein